MEYPTDAVQRQCILQDSAVAETVPSRMADAAEYALKILDRALSKDPPLVQKDFKYPNLHRLHFDPRLRRDDLLNCKVCNMIDVY